MPWSHSVTFQGTGDTCTWTTHPLADNDIVSFLTIVGTTGISINTNYYVVSKATSTFQLSLTLGGSPLNLTTDGTGIISYGTGLSPKSSDYFYIVLQGCDNEADLGDSTKGVSRAFNVLGVEPIFEPISEPTKKVGGVIRASRVDSVKLSVKFVDFLVSASSANQDFTDLLYLLRTMLKKEYIAIVATDLLRGATGDPFSNDYINKAIEPIESSKSANFENGSDDLTITFQERTAGTIV